MPRSPEELYELFLALAPPRLEAARRALALSDPAQRLRELEAALVPLAVDAALLGAEGVTTLARAIPYAAPEPRQALESALNALGEAAQALGRHDASGARVDEAALIAQAKRLGAEAPTSEAPPRDALTRVSNLPSASSTEQREPSQEPASASGPWQPELAEDMVAAFLDECTERLDGLSERLLVLEQRGSDPALVAEIFRDLHTLKGSSAFAGLKPMNQVAHRAEDLIGELRAGKRESSRVLIDVLLETLDVLRAILSRARAGQSLDLDLSPLLARLENPETAPTRSPEKSTLALGPAQAEPTPGAATLRIDFSKVDQLLNLVGEAVLARGRLLGAVDTQTGLVRELAQLRTKLAARASQESGKRTEGQHRQDSPWLAELQRIERILRESHDEVAGGLGGLTAAVSQLRDHVMKLRMVPIARLFTKYQRTVRELAQKLGKEVAVELSGTETELDKVLVERLEDPLLHLVRNAVDHGIEPPEERVAAGKTRLGTLSLGALQRGGQILVAIRDDGRGMDPDRLRQKGIERGIWTAAEAAAKTEAECFDLVFQPGFSTKEAVSDVSGRGVGMDVVKAAIHQLKGGIFIDSELGRGTTIELRLPLTLAITQVLVARLGQELIAIPLDAVVSAQQKPEGFETVAGGACLRIGDRLVPVVELARVLGLDHDVPILDPSQASVVLVLVGTEELGLLVDQVLGRHEVVIKSLGPMLGGTPCAAGATVLGDRVLLVVDLAQVVERARNTSSVRPPPPRAITRMRARILVAEDSDVIRETVRRELERAGFEVRVAADGLQALELARRERFDLVSTDVMMPGLDGFGLARALRQDPRYREVPIVMVTSKDSRMDALRGQDAGANAYLTKPSDVGLLIRTVEDLLTRSHQHLPPGETGSTRE